jgi:hypothetical protein
VLPSPQADTAHIYFLPTATMLYHVRLQYGIHVDAANSTEAFQKACRALRENPGSHIASVRQPDAPKGKPSFLKRLVTGQ